MKNSNIIKKNKFRKLLRVLNENVFIYNKETDEIFEYLKNPPEEIDFELKETFPLFHENITGKEIETIKDLKLFLIEKSEKNDLILEENDVNELIKIFLSIKGEDGGIEKNLGYELEYDDKIKFKSAIIKNISDILKNSKSVKKNLEKLYDEETKVSIESQPPHGNYAFIKRKILKPIQKIKLIDVFNNLGLEDIEMLSAFSDKKFESFFKNFQIAVDNMKLVLELNLQEIKKFILNLPKSSIRFRMQKERKKLYDEANTIYEFLDKLENLRKSFFITKSMLESFLEKFCNFLKNSRAEAEKLKGFSGESTGSTFLKNVKNLEIDIIEERYVEFIHLKLDEIKTQLDEFLKKDHILDIIYEISNNTILKEIFKDMAVIFIKDIKNYEAYLNSVTQKENKTLNDVVKSFNNTILYFYTSSIEQENYFKNFYNKLIKLKRIFDNPENEKGNC